MEAAAFRGESYRTPDGRSAITLISAEELEYRLDDATILLCKYSEQRNALRVIMTALGTQQVLYFRRVPNGLLSNDGQLYLNPTALAELQHQEAIARRQQEAAAERQRTENERLAAIAATRDAEQRRQAAARDAEQRRQGEAIARAEMEHQRAVEARSYGKLSFGANGCTQDLYLQGSWDDHPIGGKVDFIAARTGEVVFTDWPGKTGGSMLGAGYYRVCRSAGSEATGVEISR